MKRLLSFTLPLLLLAGLASAESLPQPPAGHYVYTVNVSGRGDVGEMTIDLKTSGEETSARIQRKIQVKVLGVTVYRNNSTLTQSSKAGRLIALNRETNDDGNKSSLTVSLKGDQLEVSDGTKSWSVEASLIPSSPWNPEILSRKKLLDTKSGKAIAVTSKAAGQEEIVAAGHRLQATRYEQRGAEVRDLWFDDKGRLVRMVLHRDGNKVTMTLRRAP